MLVWFLVCFVVGALVTLALRSAGLAGVLVFAGCAIGLIGYFRQSDGIGDPAFTQQMIWVGWAIALAPGLAVVVSWFTDLDWTD